MFNSVESSLIAIGDVLFQKNDQGKLDILSYISRISIAKEQQLCVANRELIGNVHSVTTYEHNIIGSDHFKKNVKDDKPIRSYITKKRNVSPIVYTAQKQLTIIQNLRNIYTKNLSVAVMFSRPFTQKTATDSTITQTITSTNSFCKAKLTHDNQVKLVHYLFEHETVIPSQKDECHPLLADSRN